MRIARQFASLICFALTVISAWSLGTLPAQAELKTWDGKHAIDRIEVTMVYFLPKDRAALVDWRERLEFFRRRLELFHQREFQGQSQLVAKVVPEPVVSDRSTEQLRAGDGDFTFFRTLEEVDERLQFGRGEHKSFPILLVLSDINWRPLDDFFRVKPAGDKFEFEGQLINGIHHPGATSGGARATYLARRGVGWGLVSSDGWRVPYCGSDCVVYHEGVGHPIGLPHPEPGNGSVMSMGQYRGWLSESWLDDVQKKRLGWQTPAEEIDRKSDLFSVFKALPVPAIPKPGEDVSLKLTLLAGTSVKSCRVRVQLDVLGPWLEVARLDKLPESATVGMGRFDRPAPVSYRAEVELADGQTSEIWGYFQVRSEPRVNPQPPKSSSSEQPKSVAFPDGGEELDLLKLIDIKRDQVSGQWSLSDERLVSPKEYGARLQLPYQPPAEYRMTVIAEPLDEPNGLILGQVLSDQRFKVLLNYQSGKKTLSAIENVDGKNVGSNITSFERSLFQKGRPSEVICTVRKNSVQVQVDGREVISWEGEPSRLSMDDYWQTPNKTALFVGAYDCRYRFHRVSLTPLSGTGKELEPAKQTP